MSKDKDRIIELQRSLRIAKIALEKIMHSNNAYSIAEQALYDMLPLAPKQQLQGLVGHASKKELVL